MRLLRRIRGIVGTALTWAAGWGILGAAGYTILSLTWDLPPSLPRSSVITTGAIYGFTAGTAFSLVVPVAERRPTLHQVTLRPMTAWGGTGSMLMSIFPAVSFGWSLENGLAVLAFGRLGAGSAAGSLGVTRRGSLGGPADVARIDDSNGWAPELRS